MYDILSIIFFIAALFACGDFYKLIALVFISALFAIAGSISSISVHKSTTIEKTVVNDKK